MFSFAGNMLNSVAFDAFVFVKYSFICFPLFFCHGGCQLTSRPMTVIKRFVYNFSLLPCDTFYAAELIALCNPEGNPFNSPECGLPVFKEYPAFIDVDNNLLIVT